MPNYWLLGDPHRQRADGSWEFFYREPTHIEEYCFYRESMMLNENVSIEAIELVSDIIDSAMVVRGAMRNMKKDASI